MSSFAGWFRTAMHQEPVIVWSCIIGGTGEPGLCPTAAVAGKLYKLATESSAVASLFYAQD